MHLTLAPSSILPLRLNPHSVLPFPFSAMRFIQIVPRRLFRHKKSRSVSRSDDASFGSSSTSEDGSYKNPNGLSTPTSVLPSATDFELKQAFEMIDGDGDGKIRKEELQALLCRIGGSAPSQEELRVMLSEVDRDGDGCITLEEFHSIGSAFAPPTCDAEMRGTFEFFDADGDGRITAEELFEVFKRIGDARCTLEDCRRMIKGVDRTGDGFVYFADFSRMMDNQRRR